MYQVYKWTSRITNKVYIGATCRDPVKRAGRDGYGYRGSPYFYSAILKYGLDSFDLTILARDLTKAEAASLERRYIREYDSMNPIKGYNLHEGGFPKQVETGTRAHKISQTLKAQRSSRAYRDIMRSRMQSVWSDPDRREHMMTLRRTKNPGGMKRIPVICLETGQLFASKRDAANQLGIRASMLSKKRGYPIRVSSKYLSKHVTLVTANVDLKESELAGISREPAANYPDT